MMIQSADYIPHRKIGVAHRPIPISATLCVADVSRVTGSRDPSCKNDRILLDKIYITHNKTTMNAALMASKWNDIISNPIFKQLPYKIELNGFGQILMSPASNWHGITQFVVGDKLSKKLNKTKKHGTIIVECSMLTRDGIRVADVAWASDAFMKIYGDQTPYIKAPDICVEVVSPGNSIEEIDGRVSLYLEKGAVEVWIVEKDKKHRIFTHVGQVKESGIAPGITLI